MPGPDHPHARGVTTALIGHFGRPKGQIKRSWRDFDAHADRPAPAGAGPVIAAAVMGALADLRRPNAPLDEAPGFGARPGLDLLELALDRFLAFGRRVLGRAGPVGAVGR